MFCKHKWALLSEHTTESKMSIATNVGVEITKGSIALLERKFIQVISCEKCGKLERFVEDI